MIVQAVRHNLRLNYLSKSSITLMTETCKCLNWPTVSLNLSTTVASKLYFRQLKVKQKSKSPLLSITGLERKGSIWDHNSLFMKSDQDF